MIHTRFYDTYRDTKIRPDEMLRGFCETHRFVPVFDLKTNRMISMCDVCEIRKIVTRKMSLVNKVTTFFNPSLRLMRVKLS
jgi:hypothetical protein